MEITNERIVNFYTLSCPHTGIVKYVGKSVNIKARYSQHTSQKCLSSRKYKTKSVNWLLKLILENQKPILLIVDTCLESENWQAKEKNWIKHFNEISPLYNMTEGGDGLSGRKLSEDHKARIRAAHLGKKKNYVVYAKGKKRGEMKQETKDKISANKKGKPSHKKIPVALFVNGKIIKSYPSMTEAAADNNIRLTTVNNNIIGISKQTKLGIWKRI